MRTPLFLSVAGSVVVSVTPSSHMVWVMVPELGPSTSMVILVLFAVPLGAVCPVATVTHWDKVEVFVE